MTEITSALSGLKHMDDDEKALAALPLLADRMIYHTKRLRVIQYVDGVEGVKRYKEKFPEARTIQTRASSIAFQPKPAGYDDFICNRVNAWFLSDTALAESNRAAVEQLNIAMAPRRFDPDNHFSKSLSLSRLRKLAAVFAEHGAHLDTSTANTMSKVHNAVKVAKAQRQTGQPFGSVGHIIGDQLVLGDHSYIIEQHSGHSCIRVRINGARVRLRLDALAEFMALAGLERTPSLYSYIEYIGERAPNAKIAPSDDLLPPDVDPLADSLPENGPQSSPPPCIGERAPNANAAGTPISLAERIAALTANRVASEQIHAAACASIDGTDPLAF